MRLILIALILLALVMPTVGAKSGPPPKPTSGPPATPVVEPKATPTLGPLYLPVLEVPDGH